MILKGKLTHFEKENKIKKFEAFMRKYGNWY